LFERGFEVLDDLLGARLDRKVVGFFEAFVSKPEDVEAGLVSGNESVVIELVPPPTRD
jgi:hypothetical protein